jgi:ribosomal protein S18 acetylase RimI-like enzyme
LFTIETAYPEEREAALRLVFHHLAEAERDVRVANALHLVSTGELEPAGILVVREVEQLQAALVILPLPGAGGLIWPPHVREGPQRDAMENQLVQTALAWLRSKGAKLVQAVLVAEEVPLAAPLLRNGFKYVTQLRYLRHDLPGPVSPSANITVQTYDHAKRSLFQEVLLRTYEGTLDCPELNNVRTIEEILMGHKAQGVFKPEHWWLAFDGREPVGVLLTNSNPEARSWDIGYVGVVPEAHGQGWGRRLTQLALTEAQAAGVMHVTVAVDARNQPAWNLYTAMGFEPTAERAVYLHFFQLPRV